MILQFVIVLLLLILVCFIICICKFIKKIFSLIIKKNIVNNCKRKHSGLKNEDNYIIVREAIKDLLKENKIKVSDSELDMLVESALYK